jgi:hypothetical protein
MKKTTTRNRSKLALAREAIRMLQSKTLDSVRGGMRCPSECDMGAETCTIKTKVI